MTAMGVMATVMMVSGLRRMWRMQRPNRMPVSRSTFIHAPPFR